MTLPRPPIRASRIALLVACAALAATFFALGLHRQVTLQSLREHAQELAALRDRHPGLAACGYLGAYVVMAALAIPGALVMTLAGGALFGLAEGLVLASFGSSIGATLALLGSRFLFRDAVRRHFTGRLKQVDRGLARAGWVYLASLRLVPAIPFFVVDLLFGVTDFPVMRFYLVSQASMLPATFVYVNAGTQIERIDNLAEVLSAPILGSLLLLACLPIAARLLAKHLARG